MFIVVYDLREKGGLYMKAENGHELTGQGLEEGLAVHNAARARQDKQPIPLDYYTNPDNPQHMYGADLVTFWVNVEERGGLGNHILREYRHEINREELS